jgi:hypothetical protein
MLNSIIDSIAIKLNQEFGDSYSIYTESVEQGLNEPCFFIFLLPSSQDQVVGKRYLRKQPFDLHFFPGTKYKNKEILDVVDRLNDAMEFVTLDTNVIHGTNIHHEVVDGVLHFFVDYNFHVIKSEVPEDSMENLTSGSTLEG